MRQFMWVRRWLFAIAALLLALDAGQLSAQESDLVFKPALKRSDLTEQPLMDIAQAGERLVAVGHAGLVITSDDNGKSWQQAEVPVSATLTAVDFPSPEQGWAVGHAGVILHSADGGRSWQKQFDGRKAGNAWLAYTQKKREALEERLLAMDDDDPEREDLEYALDDAIFDEDDARAALEIGPADPFLAVRFLDNKRGFAAGAYGMFYATADGGQHWMLRAAAIDNPGRFHYYALLASSDSSLYLAGEAGLLYRSDDGGRSFLRFEDVYDGSLFGLLPLGDSVLAYGLRGHIYLQEPDSDDWREIETDNRSSLYGGGELENGAVLLLGAGGTALRMDPSQQVTEYQHPSRSTFSAALRGADGTVWLVGVDGLARLDEAGKE